jgi:hypothetical protein
MACDGLVLQSDSRLVGADPQACWRGGLPRGRADCGGGGHASIAAALGDERAMVWWGRCVAKRCNASAPMQTVFCPNASAWLQLPHLGVGAGQRAKRQAEVAGRRRQVRPAALPDLRLGPDARHEQGC